MAGTSELKLYVWTGVLRSYGDGIMFALAHSPTEARALILQKVAVWERSRAAKDLIKYPKLVREPTGFFVRGDAG